MRCCLLCFVFFVFVFVLLLLLLINVDGLQLGLQLGRYRRGGFVRFSRHQPLEAPGQLSLQSLEAGLLVVY